MIVGNFLQGGISAIHILIHPDTCSLGPLLQPQKSRDRIFSQLHSASPSLTVVSYPQIDGVKSETEIWSVQDKDSFENIIIINKIPRAFFSHNFTKSNVGE